MIRYAITDVSRTATDARSRREILLRAAGRWAAEGVGFVQLREKALAAGELLELADVLVRELQKLGGGTRLLVNGRADVALAAGADGVHLTASAGELTPAQVRKLFAVAGKGAPVVSVSCHSPAEASRAREAGADLILFGPVFAKVVGGGPVAAGTGLALLREAVEAAGRVPVLALGGATAKNAASCFQAGAAGAAGIRLFE